jgi:hypothetical protein
MRACNTVFDSMKGQQQKRILCWHLEVCVPAGGGQGRRYAIIGGGFAGVATAWHLLAAGKGSVAGLDLFDASGLGGGASGAAAGLLHPYTPKGKVPAWSILVKLSCATKSPGSVMDGHCPEPS